MNKQYIGDSVYVEWDGNMLKLTTENGYGASNTIYLEPQVYAALTEYADRVIAVSDEPPEPDGEAFRGGEAAAFEAEQQANIQRELK